jgi:hypothetical protein
MIEKSGSQVLDIEVYSRSPVRAGRLACPASLRFLDLLNNQFLGGEGEDGFLEIDPPAAADCASKLYFRKSALEIVALMQGDTRRGAGGALAAKAYPFVSKTTRRVIIELPGYLVSGDLHLPEGQDIQAVLKEQKPFFPLTDAVITDDAGLRVERPFVAVNKHQMTSLRVE